MSASWAGAVRSVGVAQESGSPQSPELRVFLHCALEVDHEDDVAIGSRRVLVAGALERTMSAEHLPLYLDLATIVIEQSITLCCWSFEYLKQEDFTDQSKLCRCSCNSNKK